MRLLICTGLSALIALPLPRPDGAAGAGFDPRTTTEDPNTVCATGCSVSNAVADLSVEEIQDLLEELAEGPREASDLALETLLFHGAQVSELWDTLDRRALEPDHHALLERELARSHARLDARFVGTAGDERLRLGARRLPLGIKQHLFAEETSGFTPPEISGTVRRVGVEHLWVRL